MCIFIYTYNIYIVCLFSCFIVLYLFMGPFICSYFIFIYILVISSSKDGIGGRSSSVRPHGRCSLVRTPGRCSFVQITGRCSLVRTLERCSLVRVPGRRSIIRTPGRCPFIQTYHIHMCIIHIFFIDIYVFYYLYIYSLLTPVGRRINCL